MLTEKKVRSMYEQEIERAASYADARRDVYHAYVYLADTLGSILEIPAKETHEKIGEILKARQPQR